MTLAPHARASVCFLLATWATFAQAAPPDTHEKLRLRNDFTDPVDVIRYYCARDASGFIWTGMLDAERKAFTLWKQSPHAESFYMAKSYEILPVPQHRNAPDSATVEVRYELTSIADPNGTKVDPPETHHSVIFELKRVQGHWKISKPDARDIHPIVLESKFQIKP